MTRICATEGCDREVGWLGHNYCDTCIATVLRTGRPPVIRQIPEWVARAQAGTLPAKTLGSSRMRNHVSRPGRIPARTVLTGLAEFAVLLLMFAVILLAAFAASPGPGVAW